MGDAAHTIVLTIAGSDSGGGAGIQADLKTFARFGVYGTSVITAVTAQNTQGVRGWERVSPALVGAQIDAVAEDLRPAAIKSGMLGDAELVRTVAAGIRRHRLAPYVLDPVMAATSGDALLDAGRDLGDRERAVPAGIAGDAQSRRGRAAARRATATTCRRWSAPRARSSPSTARARRS